MMDVAAVQGKIDWEGFDYWLTDYAPSTELTPEIKTALLAYQAARRTMVTLLAQAGIEV